MNIPQSILDEIKARTDLADLIGSYGIQLRRAGADYKACCPFHHEKTPSFVIHPNQGYYHCFGCGEKGNVFSFVMKQEGLSFGEAARKLAQQCGVTVEEKEDPDATHRARLLSLHAELAAFFRRCLKVAPEAEAARRYLATRNLPEESLEKFCVGYAPQSPEAMQKWAAKYGFSADEMDAAGVLLKSKYANGRPYNRFGGRLMFTICDRQGRPVAFSGRILTNDKKTAKYVNSPETLIFKKSNVLFGLDKAAPNIVKTPGRQAIVCEGQIDLIRCHSCGFTNTVASQGTAFTEEHVRMVKKCADSVVLVFDADGAGQKAAIKTGGEFLAAEVPVRVATLPAGEDPDSLLRDQGPEAFRTALENSESITQFQVRTLLAKERNPGSIDAIAHVSREALETIAKCPSAILRASLLAEAAKMLNLPISALEEDFSKLKSSGARKSTGGGRTQAAAPAVTTPKPPAVPATVPHLKSPVPATTSRVGYDNDVPPEDFFIDVEPPPGFESVEPPVPIAPAVELPSPQETTLCELLLQRGEEPTVAPLVERFVLDEILANVCTRKFVAAWRASKSGEGDDAFARLRGELEPGQCVWLDDILLGNERTNMSEIPPERILQDLLRQLWMSAVRRRQGELPAVSNPENDLRRLTLSSHIRLLQRAPWPRASALMVPATLA
ncbi:MAG: DNA primase [bacterium]|nr:DNA primase [bacterium]